MINNGIMKTLITKKRQEKGLKIYELANKVGVDPSLMSRIIAGQRRPTKHQLRKIADTLDIDYQELLTGYLSQEIYTILKPYPQLADKVMEVTEERITYLSGNEKLNIISLSSTVKELLSKASELQRKWQSKKPLNTVQLKKMDEHFHTAFTHESNRIEGNTLTLSETHMIVNEGITIGGKSMREHLEVINHKEAIDLIHDFVKNKVQLNSFYLKQIHQLVLKGIDKQNAGVYRSVPVRISGSAHVPPEPYRIEKMMEDYFLFYEMHKNEIHPVILAAEMHERLVSIHPFIDGNGRTSRLVMNLILLQNGYTLVNLKGDLDKKIKYFKALENVQVNHDNESFHALIIEHAIESLEEHIHLAG